MTPIPPSSAKLALGLLLAINLFNYIDRQVLAAVLGEVEHEFFPAPADGSPPTKHETELGLLGSAFMIAYMLGAPVFGYFADRVSRWKLIAAGVLLWSVASGASGLASGFVMLLITRCFVGIGEAAYGPAAPALLSDLYPVERRGQVLSWFYLAIPVGSALGFVFGGLILSLTGSWRMAFYAVVPPGILLGICCFFMHEPPRRGGATLKRASKADYLHILRTKSYVFNTLGMTAMTFALGGIAYWMPRYLSKDRLLGDPGQVNLIFGAITVLAGLCGTLLGGWLGDRLRKRGVRGSYFLVSAIAMFVGFPCLMGVLYLPFPLAWGCLFLAVFCLFFNTGPTNTALANVVPSSVRASAFALNILIIHALGDAISPTLIGIVAEHSDMNTGFLVVSGMILLAGIFWLIGTRFLDADTHQSMAVDLASS